VTFISRALVHLGHGLADGEIVKRVLAGDTGLFELLIRRHDQRVYRTARAIVRNEADADDITQETYLRAFQHLSQFEGRAKFSTWLLRIAIREALARYRENARFEDLDEIAESEMLAADPRSSPEQMLARGEIREVVQRAIDELPPTLRTVLMLREIEGMTTAEAAEVLEISEDNVNVRLHRAKAKLREKLIERAGEEGPHLFLFEAPRCERLVRRVFEQIRGRTSTWSSLGSD
jgi:RNA polymerase sigma-70 factor (ECF subfamily)